MTFQMADQSETVNSFLAHYGVKGMKWGVRREQKRVAKADKKWDRTANSGKTYFKVYNAMADECNRVTIPTINAKKEYAGDLTKNPTLMKKYEKEFERETNKVLARLSNEMVGSNASGTKRFEMYYDPKKAFPQSRIVDVKVKHEDSADISVELVWDATGHVIDIKFSEVSMEHGIDPVDDFLQHYGVKGMKWGVRRNRSPVKVAVATRAGKGVVKTTGGKYQKTSNDAIKTAIIKQKANQSTTDALTNKQLQEAITRMNLERQFHQLNGQHRSVGKKVADLILGQIGEKEAAWLGAGATTLSGNPMVGLGVGMTARAVGKKQSQPKKKDKKK